MTVVPLPDVPCVRCRLIYETPSGGVAGSRFYLSYTGSAPSGANCTTLAGDIETAYSSHLNGLIDNLWAFTEVDVLDIATNTGLSGQWSGSVTGGASGTGIPQDTCANVEFGIARRYRGGKPRMFVPPGTSANTNSANQWNSGYISNMNTGMAAFFSELEGLSVGSMGTLDHVNLSYYKGFTNITNSSGRERAVPTYRATALHDPVTGYFTKAFLGSQRRRLRSVTP